MIGHLLRGSSAECTGPVPRRLRKSSEAKNIFPQRRAPGHFATAEISAERSAEPSAEAMPARVSETYVLRTYPFRESDLIVSFFTRDQGKLRGVARRARKPKSSFGSGLERLSLVNLSYSQKETRELANLNSCDLLQSQFELLSDFDASVALDYVAEVSDHMLPANEVNERFFRLLTAVLDYMHERAPGRHLDGRNLFLSLGYASLRLSTGSGEPS